MDLAQIHFSMGTAILHSRQQATQFKLHWQGEKRREEIKQDKGELLQDLYYQEDLKRFRWWLRCYVGCEDRFSESEKEGDREIQDWSLEKDRWVLRIW